MGFIRKALYIATFGLSGLVFKETPSPARAEKPAAKQARSQTQAKAPRAKSQAARKRKAQATRAPKAPQAGRSGNGTIHELERLADLHRRGALGDDEFAAAKSKLLGTSLAPKPPEKAPATFPAVEANITAARHLGDLGANDRGTPFAPISRD
ncbi:MAG: SHOCT domain-containing protein [Actinobacteria bacterium]|nr:MAG: SHOCT domain-containing protein [Actinomycetota bacterium]